MTNPNAQFTPPPVESLDWATFVQVSHIGNVRQDNEDNRLLAPWPDKTAILAVVADGMGGSRGGRRASEITVNTFQELLDKPVPETTEAIYNALIECFYQADRRIREEGGQSFQLMGMGSTVVAAVVCQDFCVHLYAGDSRLYHFRENEQLYQTADHSIVRLLIEVGKITPEQARTHPMRSQITSCLGGREGNGQFSIDPKWDEDGLSPVRSLQKNDRLLLSSDGLHGYFSTQEIQEISAQYPEEPQAFLATLQQTALERGGKDNITGLVIDLHPPAPKAEAEEAEESESQL